MKPTVGDIVLAVCQDQGEQLQDIQTGRGDELRRCRMLMAHLVSFFHGRRAVGDRHGLQAELSRQTGIARSTLREAAVRAETCTERRFTQAAARIKRHFADASKEVIRFEEAQR